MSINESLKAVEAKLEAELKQPQTFTMPRWGWILIAMTATCLVVLVFHG